MIKEKHTHIATEHKLRNHSFLLDAAVVKESSERKRHLNGDSVGDEWKSMGWERGIGIFGNKDKA